MAYQPLYARINDNAGGYAHSLCLRGRVDNINLWLNSWFGEVLNVSAKLIDGKQIVSKPDLRTIKKEYEEDCDREDRVIIDIDIKPNQKFIISLNGIDRLKLLQDMQLKKMDNQIEALSKMMEKKDKQVLEVAQLIR